MAMMMENFSYIFVVFMFLTNLIGIGMQIGNIGEEKKSKYTTGGLLIITLITIINGLAILWWPK